MHHKSYRLYLRIFKHYLVFILLCFSTAQALATEIKQVSTKHQDQEYILSTEIDYHLTDKAKEALDNGVPLFWNLRIKIKQQRDLFWDKTILNTAINYRLQYHALLNMYRVVIVHPDSMKGITYNFSTLSAALDLMADLRNFPIQVKSTIKTEEDYYIKIKADFDRDALPLPLQPTSYINPQWYLSSDWTVWPLKK